MKNIYAEFTKKISRLAGRSAAFILAVFMIFVWLVTGPFFDFSNTWQLVINTATTIVTFLMVFIIQNTQNRDTEAMQVKLDELIMVTKKAKNSLLDIEDLDEDEIEMLKEKYIEIAKAIIKEGLKNKKAGGIELEK
ncbi:MAG: low affinity iron permease family protein [Epsilonproteobacteria bacterium]|nr:low affinity iron permease family protein [Campylobacterota bacterium]